MEENKDTEVVVEEQAVQAAQVDQAEEAPRGKFEGQKLPQRYHIYDKIMANVSLRTIDGVIIAVSVLIIVFLIIGIITGTPQ